MAQVLAANVFVGGELFLAGDTPPKEIADQITNPRAWGAGEKVADSQPERPTVESSTPAKKTTAKRASSRK